MKSTATDHESTPFQSWASAMRSAAGPPVSAATSTPARQAAGNWRRMEWALENTRGPVPKRASRVPIFDHRSAGQIQVSGSTEARTSLASLASAAIHNPPRTIHHSQGRPLIIRRNSEATT